MAQEINRKYIGSDAAMLDASETMQAQFELDLADFTAFDTTLDADFATDWEDANTAALNTDSDELVVAEQETKTDAVKDAMTDCSEIYMDIIYFAKKAFKDNKTIIKEFGQGAKYDAALRSQSKMNDFMQELFKVATGYSTQLTTAGCPPATIAAIDTTRQALSNSNITQNLAIGKRPVITQERIKLLNAAYAFMALVCDAALRVYRNNPAKLGQYRYNPPVQEDGFTAQTFYVNPTTTIAATELVYAGARIIQIQNKSSVVIVIGLSTDGSTFTGIPISVDAESNIAVTMADLAPDGSFILLQNNNATVTAEVRVRWQD